MVRYVVVFTFLPSRTLLIRASGCATVFLHPPISTPCGMFQVVLLLTDERTLPNPLPYPQICNSPYNNTCCPYKQFFMNGQPVKPAWLSIICHLQTCAISIDLCYYSLACTPCSSLDSRPITNASIGLWSPYLGSA